MSQSFPNLFNIIDYLRCNIGRSYLCTVNGYKEGAISLELDSASLNIRMSNVYSFSLSVNKERQYLVNGSIVRDVEEIIELTTAAKGDVERITVDVGFRGHEPAGSDMSLCECPEISNALGLASDFDDTEYDEDTPRYKLTDGLLYTRDNSKLYRLMEFLDHVEIP